MRTEFGKQRTSCACDECVKNCKFMPGFLIPSDLTRMIPANVVPTEWAGGRLLASPGALVMKAGRTFRIHTLVPAVKADGSCIHLDADNRCEIHAIAPFGCAFFDCGPAEPQLEQSHRGLVEVMKAWENNDLYARIWRHLDRIGHVQLKPDILRERMSKAI
jgi:Putative zinc- or iron-chelating domain